jgi:hypothetical protein
MAEIRKRITNALPATSKAQKPKSRLGQGGFYIEFRVKELIIIWLTLRVGGKAT